MTIETRLSAALSGLLLFAALNPSYAEKGPPPAQGSAAQYDGKSGAPFDLADPARIASGKNRFNSTCAQYCHGDKPPLFIGRSDLEAEYVFNTIRDGGKGATPMPPWGDIFTAEEVWELVAYVKSLGTW
jgi:mono/diheme cytochrome c family protein